MLQKPNFLQQFCCKKMLQSFSAKTNCCKNILFKAITNNTKTNFCNILIFCNISVKCCKLFKKKKLLQTSMLQTFWENYQCCKSQLLQKKNLCMFLTSISHISQAQFIFCSCLFFCLHYNFGND